MSDYILKEGCLQVLALHNEQIIVLPCKEVTDELDICIYQNRLLLKHQVSDFVREVPGRSASLGGI